MEEDLIVRLAADGAIAAITGDRISWFERQGGTAPADATGDCLSLHEISPGREWNHGGPDGLDRPRVQIDCWAAQESVVVTLERAVIARMEQYQITGSTAFWPAQLVGRNRSIEGDEPNGARIARVRLDFQFYYERT